MKTYMMRYRWEVIIVLLQAFVFYLLPLFAGPTDMMGLVFLIIFVTFLLGMAAGVFSDVIVKYLYPLLVSVMFIPTVPVYYNETAMIHAIWYLGVSSVGLVLGLVLRAIVRWIDGKSRKSELPDIKRSAKVFGVIVAVLAVGGGLWLFGFYHVKRLDNIPSLSLIGIEGEAYGYKKLQGYHREQLIEVWGEPMEVVHSNEDIWRVDDDTVVRINYNNLGEVVMVGVIEL